MRFTYVHTLFLVAETHKIRGTLIPPWPKNNHIFSSIYMFFFKYIKIYFRCKKVINLNLTLKLFFNKYFLLFPEIKKKNILIFKIIIKLSYHKILSPTTKYLDSATLYFLKLKTPVQAINYICSYHYWIHL